MNFSKNWWKFFFTHLPLSPSPLLPPPSPPPLRFSFPFPARSIVSLDFTSLTPSGCFSTSILLYPSHLLPAFLANLPKCKVIHCYTFNWIAQWIGALRMHANATGRCPVCIARCSSLSSCMKPTVWFNYPSLSWFLVPAQAKHQPEPGEQIFKLFPAIQLQNLAIITRRRREMHPHLYFAFGQIWPKSKVAVLALLAFQLSVCAETFAEGARCHQ